jgi:hypothetical protein
MSHRCKYFNTYALVKLIIVEPIYVTLQLFPKTQIILLVGIQLAYFAYFCDLAFRKRVFVSWVEPLQIFCNEAAVLLFLLVGAIFEVGGGINSFSVKTADWLQFIGIGGLLVSCATGTLIIVLSGLKMLVVAFRNWKLKRIRQTYEVEFEIDPFWLRPPYCNRLPEAFRIKQNGDENNGANEEKSSEGKKEGIKLHKEMEEVLRRKGNDNQPIRTNFVDNLSPKLSEKIRKWKPARLLSSSKQKYNMEVFLGHEEGPKKSFPMHGEENPKETHMIKISENEILVEKEERSNAEERKAEPMPLMKKRIGVKCKNSRVQMGKRTTKAMKINNKDTL